MTEQTKAIYSQIESGCKQNSKTNSIFAIIAAIGLVMSVLGAMIEQSGIMIVGVLLVSLFAFILIIRCLVAITRKGGLKNSLEIMEKTGTIRFVNEILNEQYKISGKNCLSENVYYIPGAMILGINDIIDIRRINNDYYFVTITGKQLRVMAPKVDKETVEYLISNYDITSDAPYKSYKHKIENFKNSVR